MLQETQANELSRFQQKSTEFLKLVLLLYKATQLGRIYSL